jgi:sphingosine kinase
VKLSYKLAENDKMKMTAALESSKKVNFPPPSLVFHHQNSNDLPELRHSKDDDGWTVFDDQILYVYAGKGPYVGRFVTSLNLFASRVKLISNRDYMAFPVSLPDDGLIDVMIMPMVREVTVKSLKRAYITLVH